MLTSFSVENYRAFSRRQEIEIRPLTLFFGRNSAGKSALVRFLPLLAESIRVGSSPLWLAGDVGGMAAWSELVCKATNRDVLRFELHWRDKPSLVTAWEIYGDLVDSFQETRSLSMTVGSSHRSFLQDDTTIRSWHGLVPYVHPGDAATYDLDTLKTNLGQLASHVQWIRGVAVRPPRVTLQTGHAPPTLRADGGNAMDHLIAAYSQKTPLWEMTQTFFNTFGEHLVLDNPIHGVWQLFLRPMKTDKKIRINICDTGEGYAQILPVLVALARARAGGPRILCLEHPELHLHTRAQAELANLLVASAKDPHNPAILVETHSEVLLMSVQLAIAQGKITPDMVRVYWVESLENGTSDTIPVDFNDQGQPRQTALVGAFDEAVRLGQALVTIQLSRGRPI